MIMQVRCFRVDFERPVVIDVKKVYPSSIGWENNIYVLRLNEPMQLYILKGTISYKYAVKVGLCSESCKGGIRDTDIYFAPSHNREEKFTEGYAYLCRLAEKASEMRNRTNRDPSKLREMMLKLIGDNVCGRQTIRKELMKQGYDTDEIRSEFKYLEKIGTIQFSNYPKNSKECLVWRVQSEEGLE